MKTTSLLTWIHILKLSILTLTPLMLQDLSNSNPLINIPIQHQSHKINASIAHNIRYSEIMIHNLVDRIERVFFVDDGVEEDTEGPYILFFASVGLTG
jgi:hypothetical protein